MKKKAQTTPVEPEKEKKEPGYFRQRGSTWSYTVDIGRDMLTQKRLQKTDSGFASEDEAKEACRQYLINLKAGERTEPITLGEYIVEYLENEVQTNVEEGTFINQSQWSRDYIVPLLGKHTIESLKHSHIKAFQNRMLKDGKGRGLIRNVSMVLSKTLKAAIVDEHITKSPAANAKPPTYTPKKIKIWTQEEAKDFIIRSESYWLHELFVLALTTGMRIGEMLALKWADIDFKTNTITIDKSLKYTGESGLFIKGPKNDNAYRSIVIPKLTANKLLALKAKQPPGVEIVFQDQNEYLYPSASSRYFSTVCKELGMPKIRFHELRHTHASHMLRKHSIKVVAERLGDTPATVLETYAHVLPGMQQEVADGIDEDF